MKPTCSARQSASAASDISAMPIPPTRSTPPSGLSMPAMRFKSVLLPEPEGPISATNSPAAISSVMSFSTGTICPPRRYDFERFLISTIGCALIEWSFARGGDLDAVLHALGRLQHDFVACLHSRHLHELTHCRTGLHRHLGRLAVLDDENDL